MAHARTRALIAATIVVTGILAGTTFDRAIVGGPAWRALGAEAWAEYSRRADLGPGIVAYSVEGIGAAVLMIASAVSHRFDRGKGAAVPLYLGTAFSVAGLLLTAKAAPIILGLAKPLSAHALQEAFQAFFLWGLYLRGATDLLAFVAAVWALSRLDHSNQ